MSVLGSTYKVLRSQERAHVLGAEGGSHCEGLVMFGDSKIRCLQDLRPTQMSRISQNILEFN